MSNCNWEEIHGFYSPTEYERFCHWLKRQVDGEVAEEIVTSLCSSDLPGGVGERWFLCKRSGVVWRLIAPEPPFLGAWEQLRMV